MKLSQNWTLIIVVIIVCTTIYFTTKSSCVHKCECGGNCPYGKQCPALPMYFGIPTRIPPAHPVRWHIGR